MNIDALTQTLEPHVHLLTLPPLEATNACWSLERTARPVLAVRFIRGKKARDKGSFFDECAAALQFPPYFGENWDALHDCLTDLAWLRADGYVLCVFDALHLLEHSPGDDLGNLRDVMADVFKKWNAPARPHQVRPFHLVLQTDVVDEKALRTRWLKAGWKLNRLAIR